MIPYNMAICQIQLEKYDDALKALNECIKNGFEVAQCHYYRGVAYDANGDTQKAIDEYTANIDAGEMLATCYYNRGMCYTKLGEAEKAQEDLEMALASEDDGGASGVEGEAAAAGAAGLEDAIPGAETGGQWRCRRATGLPVEDRS
jgi:tetratricopeptide (TPR) repeat protein